MSKTVAADPFNPDYIQWSGLSPRLITVRLLGQAIRLVVFALAAAVVYLILPSPYIFGGASSIAALLALNAILTPRRVRAIGYAIRDRDLFTKSGLMSRKLTVVPYVRIQYVDINVGPIERLFGLATVSVSTASPTLAATIPGLTPEIAAWMRDILTDKENLSGKPDDDTGDPRTEQPLDPTSPVIDPPVPIPEPMNQFGYISFAPPTSAGTAQ
ncbi:MAG: PH domain-containing protein [Propionibacteriaceae bacterium]|nr:PH domain-containing protein [Propionibacteriaceae bacterium]